jgi:hypothetical protein
VSGINLSEDESAVFGAFREPDEEFAGCMAGDAREKSPLETTFGKADGVLVESEVAIFLSRANAKHCLEEMHRLVLGDRVADSKVERG